jgi:hypothetical protein
MIRALRQFQSQPEMPGAAMASRRRFPFRLRGDHICQALALAILLVLPHHAKSQNPRSTPIFGVPSSKPNDTSELLYDASGTEDERQLKVLNTMRQKSLVSDAAKLLKLARQLDAEIAAANSTALTPEQLHKIAQIEKLAHSVKVGMSTCVRGSPGLRDTLWQSNH